MVTGCHIKSAKFESSLTRTIGTATKIFSFQTTIFMMSEQTVAVKSLQHTGKLVLFIIHCNSLLTYLIFSSPLLCAVTGNGLK
jgi:hypothetical protein